MDRLDVLYEDPDVLVINKPAGLLVHPTGAKREEHTLVTLLLAHDPQIAHVGEDPSRPGIVHRLDRDVSGVMMIAKTQEAYDFLKRQFVERELRKVYLALVYGRMSKDDGTIDFKIARSKARGRMVARPESQEGKEAITEYEVLERYKTATYVQVIIKTGRTHQIRAHFKAINHPVVGDQLYGRARMKNIRPIPLDRLFLHATSLTVTLPSGERKTFESLLPKSLETILATLPKN